MEVKIYVLYDPTTSTIRYIGRTKQKLNKRLLGHIHKAKKGDSNSHKDNWIRKLLKNGIRPRIRTIKVLKNVTWKESHLEEKRLIQKHLIKHRLVNGDDRGPGFTGSKNVSPEQELARINNLKDFYSVEKNKKNFYNEIHCYDQHGDYLRSYKSAVFAAKDLGIITRQITNHRNKRDNYNAQVNNIKGYNFSRYKHDNIPVYFKANRNILSVRIINNSTKEFKDFSTFKSFISHYKMSEWDHRNYVKGKLTQKMKDFLKNYTIKSL